MQPKRLLLAVILLSILPACDRDDTPRSDHCVKLQNAVTTGNVNDARTVINMMIQALPVTSQDYTGQNLAKLVARISQQCSAVSSVDCFDCIKTLPTQSEIRISFAGIGGPVEKTIDITYTSGNKMTFSNMHE